MVQSLHNRSPQEGARASYQVDVIRLRKALLDSGMTQAELARTVGISQQAIYKLLNGLSKRSSHLHRIARALKLRTEDLETTVVEVAA